MNNEILKIISENIPKNSAVVLAFSGGPDSLFLLQKLIEFKKKHPLKIVLAHFNHKLRGKDSNEDEKFSKKTAEKYGVKFETASYDIKNFAKKHMLNIEEAARIKRYEFLEVTRKKYKAEAILTAHHLDDNIETFIINFLRGSGIQGLKSMQKKNGNILRPLLSVEKSEILKYLKSKKLDYRTDKSNFDKNLLRNRIRIDIVPLLKKIQPKLSQTFIQTWLNLNELYDYTESQGQNWIKNNSISENEFNRNEFNKLHIFLRKKILQSIYEDIYGSVSGLTKENLNRLISDIKSLASGKKAPFGKKHMIILSRNTFKIVKYKA